MSFNINFKKFLKRKEKFRKKWPESFNLEENSFSIEELDFLDDWYTKYKRVHLLLQKRACVVFDMGSSLFKTACWGNDSDELKYENINQYLGEFQGKFAVTDNEGIKKSSWKSQTAIIEGFFFYFIFIFQFIRFIFI